MKDNIWNLKIEVKIGDIIKIGFLGLAIGIVMGLFI